MRKNIYSLKTPGFAGKRAFGDWPNYPLERYINLFYYLKYGEGEKEKRIIKVINREGDLHLRAVGVSTLSEIVAQAFPNDYVFYNKRNKEAIKFLGIDAKLPANLSDGDAFLWYNRALKPLIADYSEIVYDNKIEELNSKTTIHHEVDQFFNWLYENKFFEEENAFSEPIGKVSKIILKSYNHFKQNLEIDLTYPKGHEKVGQPLDKICIIGQSGTGKTTLLELIKNFTFLKNKNTNITKVGENEVEVEYSYKKIKLYVSSNENNDLTCKIINKGNKNDIKNYKSEPKLINFPAYSVQNFDDFIEIEDKTLIKNINIDGIIDFSKSEISKRLFKKMLSEIEEYKQKEYQISIILKNKISQGNIMESIGELEEEIKQFKNTVNPLIDYANFTNNILEFFNLEIKTQIDEHTIFAKGGIELKHKKGDNIEFDNKNISLGTKQILEKTLSLYNLLPYNSIILIDEPENSLYPNIQKEYIKLLTSETWQNVNENERLEKSCQFFFATHSPTIASEFDPWEIIELKNINGLIEQENYLKDPNKVRHIDNYKFYPKYLRWDSILNRVFDIKEQGDVERKKALNKFAELNVKINYLEKEEKENTEEYKKIYDERIELGQKLDWRVK